MAKEFPKLIDFLPSIYHASNNGKDAFLPGFMAILEELLTGIEDSKLKKNKSFAEMLDIVGDIFFPCSPIFTPKYENENEIKTDFNQHFSEDIDGYFRWLGKLMDLVVNEDWDLEKKRMVISKIIPLYRIRGTKRGLEEYLTIYVGGKVEIIEEQNPLQLEVTSHVEVNTLIGGLPPNFFVVNITLASPDPKVIKQMQKAVESIINIEKPAHTDYKVNVITDSFQIEYHSKVEVDTLLWS